MSYRGVLALLTGLALTAMQSAVMAQAVTIEALQSAGRLQVKASLQPAADIVAGQKVELVLEVATDRWFAGGTRIDVPEVPGLVILQTEQFASNASELRNGQSWVLQRWLLDVYPQREGDFAIGPVALEVKINVEDAGEVSGKLLSPPVSFSVTRPPALAQAEHWVAAPDYQVSQTFDHPLEQLQVGDAFEREIVFAASDVMAMMLPAFEAEEIPGLASYPLPPELSNSSNRGVTVARRVERISYVVQAPGNYQLPARDYFWWDTGNARVQLLTLRAVELVVGGTAEAPISAGQLARKLDWRLMLAVLAAVVLLPGLALLARRLPGLPLARLMAPLHRLAAAWREMRKPALPASLNPGSSAGD